MAKGRRYSIELNDDIGSGIFFHKKGPRTATIPQAARSKLMLYFGNRIPLHKCCRDICHFIDDATCVEMDGWCRIGNWQASLIEVIKNTAAVYSIHKLLLVFCSQIKV